MNGYHLFIANILKRILICRVTKQQNWFQLLKKNKYVLHIRNLQLYFLVLDLGMKITKMYRCFNLINPLGWKNILILIRRRKNS